MSEVISFNTAESLETKIETPVNVFNLVAEDDPILKEVMPPFDFSNPPINPNTLASTLVETCKLNKGLGLAANQCGLRHRVFVMGAEDNYVAFFNPRIVAQSSELVHMTEGCLTFPLLAVKITRPSGVVVEYEDFTGTTKKAHFTGMTARCFFHELDHLNGITFTEKAKPLALKMAKDKQKKLLKKHFKLKK